MRWRGEFILLLLLIIAAVIGGAVFLISDNNSPRVLSSNNAQVAKVDMSNQEVQVTTPNGWLTYEDAKTNYTFEYPATWGEVKRILIEGGYEYSFSEREEVKLFGGEDSARRKVIDGDVGRFNSFSKVNGSVLLCASTDCKSSVSVPQEEVRLFKNRRGLSAMETFLYNERGLYLVGVVNSERSAYPGVTLFVLIDEAPARVDIEAETEAAHSRNFDFFGDIRSFLDYLE